MGGRHAACADCLCLCCNLGDRTVCHCYRWSRRATVDYGEGLACYHCGWRECQYVSRCRCSTVRHQVCCWCCCRNCWEVLCEGTNAATPATAAMAIMPSMIFPVRLNLNLDFCFSSNSHPPLPQTHWVSFTSIDILIEDHES